MDAAAPLGATKPIGYFALLKKNRAFRRLWLGNVVSLTGDWFSTIALFDMLLEFTGRGESVGYALMARFIPTFLFGPLGGVVADRFPRRTILVTCDLVRAAILPLFLFVRGPDTVWLAYLFTFVQLTASAFFDPAEQASTGAVVPREEIVTANTLQGLTWSTMLACGAMFGGVATELFGRKAAFLIDSGSYLASALFISGAQIPRQAALPKATSLAEWLGLTQLVEGLRYFGAQPRVRRVILVKAGWGLAGGGAILLYSIFGERVFPLGKTAATGIGVLYASRGVGALLGPLVARHFGGDDEAALQRAITICFFGTAAAYFAFAISPALVLAAIALACAHMAVSTMWIFSSALVNLWVPDALRGRAFSADLSLFTLALTVSTWSTGFGLDHLHLSPRVLMSLLAAVMLIPATAWILTGRKQQVTLE